MADIITIPMQPLNMYGELVTEDGIEVKNAASISVGTDTITIPMQPAGYGSVLITVKLCPYPIPAISADRTAGCAPLQVAFSSTASEFLVSQLWTLGSGVTSADANPSYEYTAGGDYAIALTGYNQAGSRQASGTIHVLNPPIAGLEASATSGTAPLTVNFTAVCTGDIDNYDWDFGDGHTSGDQNPSHQYTAAGTYDLGLIASNPYCSDEIVLADYIVVSSSAHWETRFNNGYWEPIDFEGLRAEWTGTDWAPVETWEGIFLWIQVTGSWASGYRPTKIRLTTSNGVMTYGFLQSGWGAEYAIAGYGDGTYSSVEEWDIDWWRGTDMQNMMLKMDSTSARLTNIEFWVEG